MTSKRHTRSSSTPETASSRRNLLPPTYGPRASIPSRNFLQDPERLLHRRSTFPPGQQEQPVQRANRPFVVNEDGEFEPERADFEEGDETEEGSEQDLGVDEGYEMCVPQTPAAIGEEEKGRIILPPLEEGSCPFGPFIDIPDDQEEYKGVNAVPPPASHLAHEIEDALLTDYSPPTSPEPICDTPIHSPTQPTTLPSPQSFLARRVQGHFSSTQSSSSASITPHPHNPPLIYAPRPTLTTDRPFSDHDNYPPLLSYFPTASRNPQDTRSNPVPTSSSSPPTAPNASDSPAGPHRTEIQTRPSQQDINVVENTEYAGGESDEDDDDDDSEEAVSDFDQAEFEGMKIKSYYFRVPKSSEECAIKFTRVQPVLESFMNERFEEFFISLLISCYGNDDDILEIPHVYIGLSSGDISFPSINEFPAELRQADLGIVLCRVRTSWSAASETNSKLPFQNLRTGISVGFGERYSTTLGVIIKKTNGQYIGITSGHLLDKTSVGTDITQPGLLEFNRQLEKLRKSSTQWQREIDSAPDSEQRDLSIIEKGKVDIAIADAEKFIGNTPAETAVKIKAGTIITREFKTVRLDHRRCISDFLLFDIEQARQPVKIERWPFTPPDTGELSKGDWRLLREWGQISLDDHVRKNGAVTGITFGFIAGVLASWKSPAFKTLVNEYYVLEEADVRNHRFSAQGDSGAALVSKEGKLVGFIMARATVEDFEVVVHPRTSIPDLKAMKMNRKDGEVDMEKVWFESFPEIELTLVLCASVLEKRAGIHGMGALHLDF